MKKKIFIFSLILLFSLFLRFYKLGEVPSGVTNDETKYIYSAYSIWYTHHDISGKFLPLSFNLDNSLSPVPVYLLAPVIGIFGMSPFTGRFLFALAGFLSVILVFLIAKKLFNNFYIGIASSFTIGVSPWHLQFSRSAYEGILALFFYLLATYIFLITIKKGKIYLSIPFFFIGFYSYHSTKIFFIFYIPLLLFLYRKEIIKAKRSLGLFIIGVIFIISSFIFVVKTQNVTRGEIFFLSNLDSAAKTVDQERTVTKDSTPLFLRNIFNNKPLYLLRVAKENYLEAFSPQFLFLYGETSGLAGIYGIFLHGEFYTIELILLSFGVFFIFMQKDKRVRNFVIISLLLSPLPSAFTIDRSYSLRSITMLPFFVILVGCGIYYLFDYQKKNFFKKLLLLFLGLIYFFQIASYLYQYHFRYSVYGAESWFRSSREVVELIGGKKDKYKNIYIVSKSDLLIQYAFFNKVNPELIRKLYNSKQQIKIDNVYFLNGCIDTKEKIFTPLEYLPNNTLYIAPADCHKEALPKQTITQSSEPLRVIWKIYERKDY